MKLDLFEFARQQETASGSLPLTRLDRIESPDRRGALSWTATGSMRGRHGNARLDLAVDGEVVLTCQRCLQPMTEPVKIRSKFLVAGSEEIADALDQDDDYDVLVASADFDLDELIEDEVILALPIAPRHAVCPTGAADLVLGSKKPSPFAALAALKTSLPKKTGDDDVH